MSETVPVGRVGRKPVIDADALIRAAWDLFERDGYDATTMSAIAEKAGISRRTLFNHVPGKEALLFPGFDSYMEEFTSRLIARPVGEPILNAMMSVVVELQHLTNSSAFDVVNGPNVMNARLRPEALAYIKDQSTAWMNRAVIAWLGDTPENRTKAAIVSALVAQVTNEVSRIQAVEGAKVETALDRAMTIVREILV